MRQESKQRKILAILFWILTIICMCAVFYFSSRPANESASQSSTITLLLRRLFHTQAISDHFVRKLAHFTEFSGLGFLASCAMHFSIKRHTLCGALIGSAYAGTDEFHQRFVEGRSCQFSDWTLDTLGVLTGTLIYLIVFSIANCVIQRIIKHKNQSKGDIIK